MPDAQIKNLLSILRQAAENGQPGIKLNIWCDTPETKQIIQEQITTQLPEFTAAIYREKKNITADARKRLADDLRKRMLGVLTWRGLDECPTPAGIKPLLKGLRKAKLWAALSDIYRIYVVTRLPSPNDPHMRFYLEADNEMPEQFWNRFKTRALGFMYAAEHPEKKGLMLFAPEQIRQDFICVDITSEQGKQFLSDAQNNLKNLLCDPVIKILHAEMIRRAIEQEGLNRFDAIAGFGMIVQALVRMQFMQGEPDKLYGLEEFLVEKTNAPEFVPSRHSGCSSGASSWEPKQPTPEIDGGLLYSFILLRTAELTDKSGVMVEKARNTIVEHLNKKLEEKPKSTQDVLEVVESLFKSKSVSLPAWFEAMADIYRNPEVKSHAKLKM